MIFDACHRMTPFCGDCTLEQGKAGGVATWPRQACHGTGADRINDADKYDWDASDYLI